MKPADTAFTALLVLSLVALSSENELVDRIRSQAPYGLSVCLANCESEVLECSIKCFFEEPLKCLGSCLIHGEGDGRETTAFTAQADGCFMQCAQSILDCLAGCTTEGDMNGDSSRREVLGPLPPLHAVPVGGAAPPV
ncbi:hypothetical protein SAY87_006090 [Trapa incisa]|uniref:Uncharacterized protein n=2 Tax=Trapa TaxID=22665 RepID=A0AAN7KYC1_TRANT|nr:hypothetical protein SAY87_006090 [Trapa incisa]KAK4772643.1 hypothetical protein SAY86_014418 [Trapa natans]